MRKMTRKMISTVAFTGLLATSALLGATAATADPAFSDQTVTIHDPNTAPNGLPRLVSVDVGHHDTFDRVVFRFSSRAPGYTVGYVSAVRADGSGAAVPLEGSAFLHIGFAVVASGQVGAPAAPQGTQTPHFAMLRQVKGAGDFEGTVSFGLGLASKAGFRAFTLTDPDRVVVDVAMSSGTDLPVTGRHIERQLAVAVALWVVGAAFVVGVRRRLS